MTNREFKEKLIEAFKTHMFMKDWDHHTVNELLYVLEHDSRFNGEDFNISISKLNSGWWSIPSLNVFVDTHTRGMWFDDDAIQFEIDEFDFDGKIMKVNCITVHEREE